MSLSELYNESLIEYYGKNDFLYERVCRCLKPTVSLDF